MIELNYKAMGAGEPVVVLHGLFGTLDNWQTIGRQLSETYSVFLLDQRNHGRSPHSEGNFDYPMLADDLRNFMESQWLHGGAMVVGHSMGGKVAMQFALSYPELVKKLVVIDMAPKAYRGGHDDIFDALLSLDLFQVESRQQVEDYLMKKLENEVGTVQFLLKNLSRNNFPKVGEAQFEWKMNLKNLYQNYQNILKPLQFEAPFLGETLFLRGGKSNYIKDSDLADTRKIFPNAHFVTIEGAGHWVHADKPKELMIELKHFLSR
ncbi:MAG: hypothetical protein RL757_165 [Bacteroidota bacterium]|jgi:pimeloyl-ACP methyl ester carboxylesterase